MKQFSGSPNSAPHLLKLGEALVKIAGMENPPRLFVARSDALAAITPAIEERLNVTRAYEDLSKSTDGSF